MNQFKKLSLFALFALPSIFIQSSNQNITILNSVVSTLQTIPNPNNTINILYTTIKGSLDQAAKDPLFMTQLINPVAMQATLDKVIIALTENGHNETALALFSGKSWSAINYDWYTPRQTFPSRDGSNNMLSPFAYVMLEHDKKIYKAVQDNNYQEALSLAPTGYEWDTPRNIFIIPEFNTATSPVAYIGYYAAKNKDANFILSSLIPLATNPTNKNYLANLALPIKQAQDQEQETKKTIQRINNPMSSSGW